MTRRTAAPRWTLDELKARAPAVHAALIRGQVVIKEDRPKWSAAMPTARRWPGGEMVTFPSKTEARVFDRLVREVAATPGARLLRQVPLPLFSIDGNARGVPFVLRVDFVIVFASGSWRAIEAKTKRKSREWARGAAAARACGYAIEEVDR